MQLPLAAAVLGVEAAGVRDVEDADETEMNYNLVYVHLSIDSLSKNKICKPNFTFVFLQLETEIK